MDKDVTREHYDRLAATYDQNWAYSPQFTTWMNGQIQDRLRLTTADTAADIGCGTGLYARGLATHAAEVTCADPSPAMLAQIPASHNITTVRASAEDLADGRTALPHRTYHAILMKEALHHVRPGDRSRVITGLARLLAPGGRILVVMLPAQITYPLWPEALSLYAARQPDPAAIAAGMSAAGLDTDLTCASFPLAFQTSHYLHMVRNRYMSLLAEFTDDQLEAGIARIRSDHPGDRVTFTDTFAFILGTAP
jgi:ubiquinone/menaquinone biosynthesis C-methylase UbiE